MLDNELSFVTLLSLVVNMAPWEIIIIIVGQKKYLRWWRGHTQMQLLRGKGHLRLANAVKAGQAAKLYLLYKFCGGTGPQRVHKDLLHVTAVEKVNRLYGQDINGCDTVKYLLTGQLFQEWDKVLYSFF